MGFHVCGRRLQPGAHAEAAVNASSLRISRGRSVSGARKTRLLGAYSPTAKLTNSRKQRHETKKEKADRFDYPFFSSLLGPWHRFFRFYLVLWDGVGANNHHCASPKRSRIARLTP